MELFWMHTGFPRSGGSLPSLQRNRGEELWSQTDNTSSSENAIPFSPLSSPFIAQGEEVVTTHHITITLCPLEQRYTKISPLINAPLKKLTTIMYNSSKVVPTCKGRFTHTPHRFRLGTVFYMTARASDLARVNHYWKVLPIQTCRLM